ncbi:MAG: hypothetical protein JO022_08555 [Acidobacteriaceae bacterium]|nr:hypothetical protein [Acidobacteriaceae bacterium]
MKIWQELALLMLLTAALIAALPRLVMVRRRKPEDRERARRNTVNRIGRLGTGFIDEFQNETIFYSYEIGGVAYLAAQNVSGLRDRLPADSDAFAGVVSIKYEMTNPANSIIVCEDWSGLDLAPLRVRSSK